MTIDFTKKDASIVKASKKLVDELLSLNMNNRNPKKGHIEWIKSFIQAKEFLLTGQGISVSDSGVLIDGQHRLMAIRDAGYPPVELLIVTGLEEKSKIYVDQHAKRSTSDMLKIVLNQEISQRMAAIINFHLRLKETNDDFVTMPGRSNLDDVVDAMNDHHYIISLLCNAMGNLGRAGTLCGLFHYAKKYDEDTALQLAEWVGSGENMRHDDSSYRFREYLLGRGKKNYGGSAQLIDYKHSVYACIAHAKAEKLSRLLPAHSWNELPKRQKVQVVKAADAVRKAA